MIYLLFVTDLLIVIMTLILTLRVLHTCTMFEVRKVWHTSVRALCSHNLENHLTTQTLTYRPYDLSDVQVLYK